MTHIFDKCESLPYIPDLSSFDSNSVINKGNIQPNLDNLNKIHEYEILSPDCSNFDLSFKILLVGGVCSGKTLLINFGIRNDFDISSITPTLSFEYTIFFVRFKDKIIRLQILDTGGSEQFHSVVKSFYRGSSLVLFLYAINNSANFNSLNSRIEDCKEYCSPNTKLFLV